MRGINAGSDTILSGASFGHQMTVTATDGWPVEPVTTDAFYIGMGERYDVEVTLDDGVFPLVATPVGKKGIARALVRTGPGRAPADDTTPRELSGQVLMGTDLRPAEPSRLDPTAPDPQQLHHLPGHIQPHSGAANAHPL